MAHDIFRAFRLAIGKTQEQMADELKPPRDESTISLLETGQRCGSVHFIYPYLKYCREQAKRHRVPKRLIPTLKDFYDINPKKTTVRKRGYKRRTRGRKATA
jgi:hypothetical protein